MKKIAQSLSVIVLSLMSGTFVFIANAQTPAGNTAPQVKPIRAVLRPPVTTYTVESTDPEKAPLSYQWNMNIACGTSKSAGGPEASWSHPEGPPQVGCPHEDGTSHVGTITVRVSNSFAVVTCSYEGSESGTGTPCSTEVTATANVKSSAGSSVQSVKSSSGFLWLGLLVLVSAAVVYLRRMKKPKLRCEKEYAEEQAARSRRDQTRKDFEGINRLRSSLEAAKKAVESATKEAENAVRAAGKKWTASGSADWEGQHTELKREGYQNKETGEKADAALQKAKHTKELAEQSQSAYDQSGGESTWSHLRDEMLSAETLWQAADAALKTCLLVPVNTLSSPGAVSAPPAPPPSTSSTSTTPPAVSAKPTQEPGFVCRTGDRRNNKVETITVELLDLQTVTLKQDKIYSDTGNEAMKFVDYLQTLKDLFSLGKNIKGGISGYLGGSLTGTADAVGLPDFLTWYDKGIDELTKSMYKLFEIMQDKQRLGDYWLEYKTKRVTLTCTRSEVCTDNVWIKECSLTITDLGTSSHRTPPQQVHVIRELNPAITRLFNQLRSRYTPDKNKAKQFTQSCNCE